MPETTLSAVSLPPSEAIRFFRQKVSMTSEHWTDLWQEAHSRAFTVSGAATEALVEDFRREVARAIEEGTTLDQFRSAFDGIVKKHGWQHTGKPGWRAEIIYRTNLSMAYSAGRYREMTEPDVLEQFPYWRYQHNPAQHPREQHLAWDGITLRADDGWWNTHWTPNGWNCHCSIEPMSARELGRSGKSGPDRAPPLNEREWRNPKTGEVEQVPAGVDPGFGYNPGKAWLDGEAGGRVSRGDPAPRRTRLRAESVPSPDALRVEEVPASRPHLSLPPAEPVTPDTRNWIAQQLEDRKPDGTARIVGNLPPSALEALSAEQELPHTAAITLTSRGLQHLARDSKAAAGRGLSVTDLRRLPSLLARPQAVLRDKQSGMILLVFAADDPAEQRLGKVVVQLAVNASITGGGRKRQLVNLVKTAGLVAAHNLLQRQRYDMLSGEM